MSLPKVAYFCMEMAVDQSLYTYSGGLGYLAGSHMRSAGHLDLPMVGVTILWTHGYGEQVIEPKTKKAKIEYDARPHDVLQDTGVSVVVDIFNEPVRVKALLLPKNKFNTAPIYYLTTDIEENKPEHRKLTHVLYDSDQRTRIAQEIILGIGGLRVLRAAAEHINIIHMNEGHALPAAFELLDEFNGDMEQVRQRLVFTTHTPVAAGNESHPAHLLHEAGFFGETPLDRAIELGGDDFSLTVAALRMSHIANGVSQLHGHVANNMWNWVHGRCPIIAITNAANQEYWQDERIKQAADPETLLATKREMKQELFKRVKEQTGKTFDPDVLTIVWARRFTEYKRAWLIFKDKDRLNRLLESNKIQLLFSGKYHPKDTQGRDMFDTIVSYAETMPNLAILPNYELELSAELKRGADVWLNTPLRPMEASGTSGMTANMNGAIHFSVLDGWAVEGTYHHINGFLINEQSADDYLPIDERHRQDYESMMQVLEQDIIPTYYEDKARWAHLMDQAILTSTSFFNSDRMVIEYFNRLYKPVAL